MFETFCRSSSKILLLQTNGEEAVLRSRAFPVLPVHDAATLPVSPPSSQSAIGIFSRPAWMPTFPCRRLIHAMLAPARQPHKPYFSPVKKANPDLCRSSAGLSLVIMLDLAIIASCLFS